MGEEASGEIEGSVWAFFALKKRNWIYVYALVYEFGRGEGRGGEKTDLVYDLSLNCVTIVCDGDSFETVSAVCVLLRDNFIIRTSLRNE